MSMSELVLSDLTEGVNTSGDTGKTPQLLPTMLFGTSLSSIHSPEAYDLPQYEHVTTCIKYYLT